MRVLAQSFAPELVDQRHLLQLRECDQPRAYAVVNVMGVIGDFVGQVTQLRFQAGLGAIQKTPPHATGLFGFERARVGHRAMLQNTFARLKAQVQAIKQRVARLQLIDHLQALQVVLKTAMGRHAFVQRVLTRMAKRRMTEIMRQADGFDQIFVQAQRAGDGTPQLCHLQ